MRCEGKIIGKIWLQLLGNREDILKTETSHNACIINFFFFFWKSMNLKIGLSLVPTLIFCGSLTLGKLFYPPKTDLLSL